jgi:hypothetical protein
MVAGLPACSPATSSSPRETFKATASWWRGCRRVARQHPHLHKTQRRPGVARCHLLHAYGARRQRPACSATPSSTLHYAANDDVGAAGEQPGAIRHGEDDADLDEAAGGQCGAISTAPTSWMTTTLTRLPACSAAASPPPARRSDNIRTGAAGGQRAPSPWRPRAG